MTPIRKFTSHNDACAAVTEAGFTYLRDSNENSSGAWSFAPTVEYRQLETGERVSVLWNSGDGLVLRRG